MGYKENLHQEKNLPFPAIFFDVAELVFSRQTNKFGAFLQGNDGRISHTFSVSHNKRSTFLCTKNGNGVVHIALYTYGFYHFIEYIATKIFGKPHKFVKKQTACIRIILLPIRVRSTE